MTGAWFWWLMIAVLVAGALINVSEAGKPKAHKTTSNSTAVATVIIHALLILGIAHYGLGGGR